VVALVAALVPRVAQEVLVVAVVGLEAHHFQVVLEIHHQQPHRKAIMVVLILRNQELALLVAGAEQGQLEQMRRPASQETVGLEARRLFLVRPLHTLVVAVGEQSAELLGQVVLAEVALDLIQLLALLELQTQEVVEVVEVVIMLQLAMAAQAAPVS
jgi:hypothetical protein